MLNNKRCQLDYLFYGKQVKMFHFNTIKKSSCEKSFFLTFNLKQTTILIFCCIFCTCS